MAFRYLLAAALILFGYPSFAQPSRNEDLKRKIDSLWPNPTTHNMKLALPLAQELEERTRQDSAVNPRAYAEACDQYLGLIMYYLPGFQNAVFWHTKAINILKALNDTASVAYGEALTNRGNLLANLGAFHAAEQDAIEARKVLVGMPITKTIGYYSATNTLANVYNATGEYYRAEPLYLEIEKLLSMRPDVYELILSNLSTLYFNIGSFTKSEECMLHSIAYFKKRDSAKYAVALNNYAAVCLLSNRLDTAEKMCRQALEIFEQHHDTASLAYPSTQLNMGRILLTKRMFKESLTYFKKALSLDESIAGKNSVHYWEAAQMIGEFYMVTGELERSDSVLRMAQANAEDLIGTQSSLALSIMQSEIVVLAGQGRYNEAMDMMGVLDSRLYDFLQKNYAPLSEAQKIEYLKILNRTADIFSVVIAGNKKRTPQQVELLFRQQLFLKGLSLKNYQLLRDRIESLKDSTLTRAYRSWTTCKELLIHQYQLPIRERFYNTDSLETAAEIFEKILYSANNDIIGSLHQNIPGVRQLSASLAKRESVVEFIRYNATAGKFKDSVVYAALVLTSGQRYPKFVALCAEAGLEKLLDYKDGDNFSHLIELYPNLIIDKGFRSSKGYKVYRKIWQPLERYLKGSHTVYYSPAGLLHLIALHALPTSAGQYIGQRYALHQLLFTGSLLLQKPNNSAQKQLSTWGAIKYGLENNYTRNRKTFRKSAPALWPKIKSSGVEIRKIDSISGAANLSYHEYRGSRATEARFKSEVNKFSGIVHISTHGFFKSPYMYQTADSANGYKKTGQPANPLYRCGLIFADGNYAWSGQYKGQNKEDGILTGYEVSQLDLSRVSMVTLSACETALGDVYDSEGVFGFQRAFKMAGADKLVLAFWSINGPKTSEFMEEFYTSLLLEKQSPRRAFRSTQLKMMKKYDPYLWAGIVLIE